MADEAFALSPIHARASLPTDGDYDAICDAFMETSRGRWFLTEYTKRNRNTDTRMVLDAIERLEQNLSSQKQAQVEAAPAIDLWPELAKAFTRTRIEIAQRLVHESNEQAFEAIRSSVEAIKSVSWALRERGFEARICDFLDVQVNAITDGYTGLLAESSVAGETEADVLAAFDALIAHVEALTKSSDPETDALDAVVHAVANAMSEDDDFAPSARDEPGVVVIPPPNPAAAATFATTPAAAATDPDAAFHEIYGDDGDIEIVEAGPPEEPLIAAPTEPEINRQRLYEAKVEPHRPPPTAAPAAQLQRSPPDETEIVDATPTEPELAVRANWGLRDEQITPAASTTQATPADRPKEQPLAHDPAHRAQPQAAGGQASLGQALLASGVIPNPAGRSDPLAPFRRMSQAEKVAFFT